MSDSFVVALSGGLDSTTLLAILFDQSFHQSDSIRCVGFEYGSKHNKYEIESAKKIAKHYDVEYSLIDLRNVGKLLKSNLLLSGGEIPEGHYNDATMSQTVVPGRNLMFASILAGYAESIGFNRIALGVHKGDHEIYPDCRKEFVKALDSCIYLSTDKSVEVYTPLIDMDKIEIVQEGLDLEVPYHLTRTCYKDQERSCGVCGSCVERLEAFKLNNVKDPIEYE
ncbi:7-cyano-7-deazaguanine synthase QueC [archaeon]|jgi:7-cyano-7-deazaguanine synthase|nr:7-cyano-7-deazaguanine synthase QueC [archaeon]